MSSRIEGSYFQKQDMEELNDQYNCLIQQIDRFQKWAFNTLFPSLEVLQYLQETINQEGDFDVIEEQRKILDQIQPLKEKAQEIFEQIQKIKALQKQ